MALSALQRAAGAAGVAHGGAAILVELAHQPMDAAFGSVEVRHVAPGRRARPADRRHRGHGLADRAVGPGRDGAQHGGAQQHRFLRFGERNGEAGRVRHDLAYQGAPRSAAADHHQLALDAVRAQGIDDVGQAIGQAAEAGDEQPFHGGDIDVEIEARDDGARIRIGMGRAIAQKFGQHVDVARQPRGVAGMGEARHDAALEIVQQLETRGARGLDGLLVGRVRADQMIDRGPCRRLAALVQPEPGHHARVVRPPDAGHEAGLLRRRHDAGRRSHDVGEPPANLDRVAGFRAPADRADAAGMGVDQGRADRRALEQPEFAGGGRREAGAQGSSRGLDLLADPRVIAQRQVAQADALEIARAPASFMGEEVPLAGERAHRARRGAGGLEREEVGEIEEMAGAVVGRRQVTLQPEQLGDLHFRRDRAADITQDVVPGIVDGARLGHGAMVHPDDHVAARLAGWTDGKRVGPRVEHHQRAGRVEAHAADGGRRQAGLGHRRAHRRGAGRPDLGRRLLDDVARLVPERDGMAGGRQQRAPFVEHAGPGARCPDIDADEGLLHEDPASPRGLSLIATPRRLDRGPPRLRSGQAPGRAERPSLDDKRLIVEIRSLRSALRASVETTELFIGDSPGIRSGQPTSKYSRHRRGRCCRSSGWPRRRPGTARRRRSRRPCPCGPSGVPPIQASYIGGLLRTKALSGVSI